MQSQLTSTLHQRPVGRHLLAQLGSLSPLSQRLLLVVGCAILFFTWLTWVPLTEIDEARFTEATREMLETGNYIIPHFNGAKRYQKPILYYWLQAGSMRVFGVNEQAARLPSALAVTLTVLLLHAFLLRWLVPVAMDEERKRVRRGAVFLGAASLAVVPLMAIWARSAVTDPTLTLFITGAMLALLQAELLTATESAPHVRRWYLLAAAGMALAFLTKGPVGVLLPVGTWLLYHISRRTLGAAARTVPWVWAILIFLLIAAPWYIATYYVDGWGFLTHFFMKENIGRFASTSMEHHGFGNRLLGLLTYLPVSLLMLFPISPSLLRDLISPADEEAVGLAAGIYPRLRRFAWIWILTVLGIFSLSRTQLPSYIQAISGAAAIIFALHVLGRSSVPVSKSLLAGVVEGCLLFILGIIWTGGPIYVLLQGKADGGPLGATSFPPQIAHPLVYLLSALGMAFLTGLLISVIRRNALLQFGWAMALWTAIFLTLILGLGPLVVKSQYGMSAAIGHTFHCQPADTPVYSYYTRTSESMVFYAQRVINYYNRGNAQNREDFLRLLPDLHNAVVMTDAPGLIEINARTRTSLFKHIGPFLVVRVGDTVDR